MSKKHKYGLLIAVEIILAYVVFSFAIDSGQIWQYAVGFALLYFAVKDAVSLRTELKSNGKTRRS